MVVNAIDPNSRKIEILVLIIHGEKVYCHHHSEYAFENMIGTNPQSPSIEKVGSPIPHSEAHYKVLKRNHKIW